MADVTIVGAAKLVSFTMPVVTVRVPLATINDQAATDVDIVPRSVRTGKKTRPSFHRNFFDFRKDLKDLT